MHNVSGRSAPRPPSRDYYAYHDDSGTAKLSTTLIHALADVMGEDVTSAGFVLYDSVNPDALDQIFAGTSDDGQGSSGHVAFTINGYQVTVYSNGQIVITPPSPPQAPRSRA